ncbi:MAG: hypothetical protein ACJAXL_000442 [Alphaproteobacteria bacterium]
MAGLVGLVDGYIKNKLFGSVFYYPDFLVRTADIVHSNNNITHNHQKTVNLFQEGAKDNINLISHNTRNLSASELMLTLFLRHLTD